MNNLFSIGQRVKTKFFSGSTSGTVVGVFNTYYVVEFYDKHGTPYTYSYQEHELIAADSEVLINSVCECGAAFTAFPESHMQYCPMFKKGM